MKEEIKNIEFINTSKDAIKPINNYDNVNKKIFTPLGSSEEEDLNKFKSVKELMDILTKDNNLD